MANKKTVLMTGASGYIASQLLQEIGGRCNLGLADVKDTDRSGTKVPGVTIADLANPDRSGYRKLFDGVDTVIHLGYRHPSRGADAPNLESFDVEFSNVQMAQNRSEER